MNQKGCGRNQLCPNLRHPSYICLEGRGKPEGLSHDSVAAKIRARHLPSTSRQRYLFSHLRR
jgi:hypothetical protein